MVVRVDGLAGQTLFDNLVVKVDGIFAERAASDAGAVASAAGPAGRAVAFR